METSAAHYSQILSRHLVTRRILENFRSYHHFTRIEPFASEEEYYEILRQNPEILAVAFSRCPHAVDFGDMTYTDFIRANMDFMGLEQTLFIELSKNEEDRKEIYEIADRIESLKAMKFLDAIVGGDELEGHVSQIVYERDGKLISLGSRERGYPTSNSMALDVFEYGDSRTLGVQVSYKTELLVEDIMTYLYINIKESNIAEISLYLYKKGGREVDIEIIDNVDDIEKLWDYAGYTVKMINILYRDADLI